MVWIFWRLSACPSQKRTTSLPIAWVYFLLTFIRIHQFFSTTSSLYSPS
jgi:hypothetical protein